jgi:hypothetical protein
MSSAQTPVARTRDRRHSPEAKLAVTRADIDRLERFCNIREVEHESCDACGFEGASYDDGSLLDALNGLGSRWRALIDANGSELRVRPQPHVWSAIEYAAHRLDITALHAFAERS